MPMPVMFSFKGNCYCTSYRQECTRWVSMAVCCSFVPFSYWHCQAIWKEIWAQFYISSNSPMVGHCRLWKCCW